MMSYYSSFTHWLLSRFEINQTHVPVTSGSWAGNEKAAAPLRSTHSDWLFSTSLPADLSQNSWQISSGLPREIHRASVANLSPRVLKITEEC